MDLSTKKCVPCEGGIPALIRNRSQIQGKYGRRLECYRLQKKITKEFIFGNTIRQ